jgi:hypothetical protein
MEGTCNDCRTYSPLNRVHCCVCGSVERVIHSEERDEIEEMKLFAYVI